MKPSIIVARFSFFLASLLFSRSGSRCFVLPSLPESSLPACRPASPCSLFNLPTCLRPKIGWHSRSLSGFTTAHLDTTPLSDDEGSNSDTMSTSMPTLGARHRAGTFCPPDCPSPFTDRVAFKLLFCAGTAALTCDKMHYRVTLLIYIYYRVFFFFFFFFIVYII